MNFSEGHFFAFLDEMNLVTILLPLTYHNGKSTSFTISYESQSSVPLDIKKIEPIENYYKYSCYAVDEIPFEKTCVVMDEYGGQTDLQMGAVMRTEEFDKKFYYSGNDLGVKCENTFTLIKIWAPTATQVRVKLSHPNDTFSEIVKMKREDKGVWMIRISRDLEYYHYSFLVCVNKKWQETVDPYAHAVTPDGDLGIIVKMKKTSVPKPKLPPFEHPVDAIIYETHIRDFSIHQNSGIKHKGYYLGTGEIGTKGKKGQVTGLSYVKELGITHIELLPFNDFAGIDELKHTQEYNWGYNPLNYNVPEGSYATNPANPYSRIVELKQMIENIHGEGLRVIMDVVYNHVYDREQSTFEKVVPGYYFRHNEFGLPSNGTGVGNDIASERLMVRKYIIDSIRFWIEEYHVDGFRFDLMGILDIDTMNAVKKICDTLTEGILLLGEGWNLNTPLDIGKKATIFNQAKIPHIAQFNDQFRDSIKGSTFNLYDKGYAFGNEHYTEEAKEAITGSIGFIQKSSSLFHQPDQSVNYVECHDNHTMWDKLLSCMPDANIDLLMKYHRLATSIVLLSQGIPFIHSGQEFFRTKQGEGNSYRSSDIINQLDWDRQWEFSENVEYVKGIIRIRKAFTCFRLRSFEEIRQNVRELPLPVPMIGLDYQNKGSVFQQVILLINPTLTIQSIPIPEGEWFIFVDENQSSLTPLRKIIGPKLEIDPVCLCLLAKK